MGYGGLKTALFGWLPFGHEASLILTGYLAFLLTLVVLRRPIRQWTAFFPTFAIGLLLAGGDVVLLGHAIAAAFRDFVLFALLPAVTTLLFRLRLAS